jgi:hypothetical protein
MSPEDNQKSETRSAEARTEGPRRPYSAPRLRWLGDVNAITRGTSAPDSRKKPQG